MLADMYALHDTLLSVLICTSVHGSGAGGALGLGFYVLISQHHSTSTMRQVRFTMTSFKGLANKVAIITGSTKGIGLSIAHRLGLDGCRVVLSSRKAANVRAAVDRLRAAGVPHVDGIECHVGDDKQRRALVDFTVSKFGRVDILVNNAGINPTMGNLLDVEESVWDKLFDVNVKAGLMMSKLVVPHMEKSGGGAILFVSSIGGYAPFPAISAYCVTKTALLGLTKAMALSCAQCKVRVNCIAPGIVKTDFSKALWESGGADAASMIPLGRFAEPDDCAGAAAFLCSDEAAYITGETVLITGGLAARL